MSSIAGLLDQWADDLEDVLRLQAIAHPERGFLRNGRLRRILLSASELAVIARGIGRESVTLRVLDASGVSDAPSRILDLLSVTVGREASGVDSDLLAGTWDSWLRVAQTSPEKRQSAFEKYVKGWRREKEKRSAIEPVDDSFTGAWCFEAVTLVTLFDLDDAPVRDVPEYPSDFADYARTHGTPLGDVILPTSDSDGSGAADTAEAGIVEPSERRAALAPGESAEATIIRAFTPVSTPSNVPTGIDAAIEEAVGPWMTVIPVDRNGMPVHELASFVRNACARLGLPAPRATPDTESDTAVDVLSTVDDWLAPHGVRLVVIDEDSDQYLAVPVLAEDVDLLAGLSADGCTVRRINDLDE